MDRDLIPSLPRGAELYLAETRELSVGASAGSITELSEAARAGAAARVLVGSRMGWASAEGIDGPSLRRLLEEAGSGAARGEEDPASCLYEGGDSGGLALGQPAWPFPEPAPLPLELKKGLALGIDARCYALDPRVRVAAARYGEIEARRLVALGGGPIKEELRSLCFAEAEVEVEAGGEAVQGRYRQAASSLSALSPDFVAREAVRRALDKLGSTAPESGPCRAILGNEAASALIGAFLGAATAENIQAGRSGLVGKRGRAVGSRPFTLRDDPAAPGLFGRAAEAPTGSLAAFDDEGVPSPPIDIFKDGYFLEPLYCLRSARREGARPNGRGFRSSYAAPVATAPFNAFIPAGEACPDALLHEAERGILLTELELGGPRSVLDPVSGDFSLPARGFAIELGRRARPLGDFRVAGNCYALIASIVALGSDLREDSLSRFRSPSLLVESLSISSS